MMTKEEIYLQSRGFVLSNIRDKLLTAVNENKPYFYIFFRVEAIKQSDVTVLKDFFSRNSWIVKEVIPYKEFMTKYAPDKPRSFTFSKISVLVIDLRESLIGYE